jgi:hypothetical protein
MRYRYSLDADSQTELLCAASAAIGFFGCWQETDLATIPENHRPHFAAIVARLRAARDAAMSEQRVSFAEGELAAPQLTYAGEM